MSQKTLSGASTITLRSLRTSEKSSTTIKKTSLSKNYPKVSKHSFSKSPTKKYSKTSLSSKISWNAHCSASHKKYKCASVTLKKSSRVSTTPTICWYWKEGKLDLPARRAAATSTPPSSTSSESWTSPNPSLFHGGSSGRPAHYTKSRVYSTASCTSSTGRRFKPS